MPPTTTTPEPILPSDTTDDQVISRVAITSISEENTNAPISKTTVDKASTTSTSIIEEESAAAANPSLPSAGNGGRGLLPSYWSIAVFFGAGVVGFVNF